MADIGAGKHAAVPVETVRRRSVGAFLSSINGITAILVVLLMLYPGWPLALRLIMAAAFLAFHFVPGLSRYDSMFCRALLPILIGGICVEAYIVLNDWSITRGLMKFFRFDSRFYESFYSAVSTLYAIITALALVKGIEDFDAIKNHVAEEIYKVRAIVQMAHYFDGARSAETSDAILGLQQQLIRYADNVASMRDRTISSENLGVLRECQRYIARLVPEDINDQNSLSAVMEAHGELGTLRAKRISAVREKIPIYLIVALWLSALGLILPFMATPPFGDDSLGELRFGQYYILFLMGSLNSFLLLMLSDISDPFDGFWQVDLSGFSDLAATLRAEMAPAGQSMARSPAP